jgi:hypothetical protein
VQPLPGIEVRGAVSYSTVYYWIATWELSITKHSVCAYSFRGIEITHGWRRLSGAGLYYPSWVHVIRSICLASMATAAAATTSSQLQSPFVDVPGLANFRDIGGWPIRDNEGNVIATVRKGVFYRGSDTAAITKAGEEKLRSLGITIDFDLRSNGQIVKAGGFKSINGIERIGCPAFPDAQYSPDKAAARYVQYASDGTEV